MPGHPNPCNVKTNRINCKVLLLSIYCVGLEQDPTAYIVSDFSVHGDFPVFATRYTKNYGFIFVCVPRVTRREQYYHKPKRNLAIKSTNRFAWLDSHKIIVNLIIMALLKLAGYFWSTTVCNECYKTLACTFKIEVFVHSHWLMG